VSRVARLYIERVGILRVCDEALQALAEQCAAMSVRLPNRIPVPVTAAPAQATSVAVSSAYTGLSAAATVLAARMELTGIKLSTGGTHNANQDETFAQRLAALDGSVHP
jgi:hypothetical protein